MIDLLIREVRIAGSPEPALVDVHVEGGVIIQIVPASAGPVPARTVVETRGALLSAPYVEPHIHLDAVLTAGEPRWNLSGTLWEGIACWSDRKATLNKQDVIDRAEEILRWQVAQGVLFVRTHVDVTDPKLEALEALLEVRDRVKDVVGLQIVAFPQEGICSFPEGEKLIEEAARRGADVVGAIPHFEDTREDGVRSVEIAIDIAVRHGMMVDVHCDEIDDEQSRFIEVLATQAMRTGLRERVTASHAAAMGSYNAAYSYKLQRIVRRSGINLVSNPLANLNLQGRFDGYPRRRGLLQAKEMLDAGVNIAFGHDSVMDPWYPLGTGNPIQVALVGAHATQLTAPSEVEECFRMVTDRSADVLCLAEGYGIARGRPANFMVLPALSPFDAVRRQVRPSHVVAHGRLIASTPPSATTLAWPGRGSELIDCIRSSDAAGATWRDWATLRRPDPPEI